MVLKGLVRVRNKNEELLSLKQALEEAKEIRNLIDDSIDEIHLRIEKLEEDGVNFNTISIEDWIGNKGNYEILNLIQRKNGFYSCTFVNSVGDHETVLAHYTKLSYHKKR